MIMMQERKSRSSRMHPMHLLKKSKGTLSEITLILDHVNFVDLGCKPLEKLFAKPRIGR